jgi:hypothetical protein
MVAADGWRRPAAHPADITSSWCTSDPARALLVVSLMRTRTTLVASAVVLVFALQGPALARGKAKKHQAHVARHARHHAAPARTVRTAPTPRAEPESVRAERELADLRAPHAAGGSAPTAMAPQADDNEVPGQRSQR